MTSNHRTVRSHATPGFSAWRQNNQYWLKTLATETELQKYYGLTGINSELTVQGVSSVQILSGYLVDALGPCEGATSVAHEQSTKAEAPQNYFPEVVSEKRH